MIRLRFLPGVKPDVRDMLRTITRRLPALLPVPDDLPVTVTPARSVPHPRTGRRLSGLFLFYAPPRSPEPEIRLAAGLADKVRGQGWTRPEALGLVATVFLHEMVHYAQLRATGRTWERGVTVRARGLLRRVQATR